MTEKTRRLLSILLALLLLTQALPAPAEEAGEWNEAVSDVVQSSWYTLTFVASGETVQSIAVLAGTAFDSLPDAPSVEGARFDGWYIGEQLIEAGFVPQNSATVTAAYHSTASAVSSLYSETDIGSVTFYSMGAPSLPEGASIKASFIENAGIANKALAAASVPEGMTARVINILSLGVSDLYWTLEGSLRVSVSLKTPIELKPGEQLFLYDARTLDAENLQPVNARFMQGYDTVDGVILPAAQFGSYVLVGVYASAPEPVQHTVTFLDAEENALEVRSLNDGEALGALVQPPEREGYAFVTWVDQDGQSVTAETVVTHDLTLVPMYLELYPATSADAYAGSVSVHVEVPQGALPQDARFRMYTVDAEGVRGKVEKAIGQKTSGIIAVDMAFVDANGEELHPLKPVAVSVTLSDLSDAKRIVVIHIKDDGEAEIVYSGEPETIKTRGAGDRKEFSFTAESFSVYAVAPVGDSGENARMTINFYNTSRANTEGGRDPLLASMIVKNSDSAETLESLIYDPGAGAVAEGEMFKGWLVVENPTGDPADYVYTAADAQNARDIEQVRAWAEAKQITEGEIVNIYALIYKTYEVRFVDEDMATIHSDAMIFLESEDSGTYTITVSYTPKSQDAEFQGWRPTQATSANVTASGQPPYPVGTTVTFSGNVVFMPEVPYGYWLSFVENGSGASYTAPQFVKRGNTTVVPAAPQRFGYSFGGWYTDRACTQAFTFGNELTQHTTLYAKWTPNATANYTVIIWKQNVDGTGYDFAESITLSGPVGSNVNAIVPQGSGEGAYATIGSYVPYTGTSGNSYYVLQNGQYVLKTVYYYNGNWYLTRTGSWYSGYSYSDRVPTVYTFSGSNYNYTGFALSDYDDPVIINPEGTAAVNVYFDRNEYTLTFQVYGYVYTVSTGDYDNSPHKYGDVGGQKVRVYWNNGAFRTTDRKNGPIYNGTVYTLTGEGWQTIKQITALYGQNISAHFPIVGTNGVTYNNGERWDPQSSTPYSEVLVYIDVMPAADVTFRLDEAERPLKTMNYYIEALPGTANTVTAPNTLYEVTNNNPVSANGKRFILYNSISARYNGVTPDEDYIDLDGFTKIGADSRWETRNGTKFYIYNTSSNGTVNFYYSRDSYKILYQDGVYLSGLGVPIDETTQATWGTSEDILYQADISSYNKGGQNYYAPERAGYVFEGWYLDDACTQPYTFTNMPKGGVIVYAKWRQIQYRVFLHPNDYNPDGSIDESLVWGDANQQTNFRVSIGEKIANGQQIDALRDEYELIGWYTDAALKKPFNFNAYVLNEQTVTSAYDKQTDYTDPYNRYGVLIGPGTNSDSINGRFWITKKLDLYAKWRAKIEGAQGINVRFISMDGTFEGGDTVRMDPLTYYLDRAEATAYSAPTPNDETQQFLHWVVQTWNGTEFVDTNVHAFAGDTFEVLKQNAQRIELPGHTEQNPKYQYIVQLRAEYGEKQQGNPVHIYWFKNDGVETSAIHSDLNLQINAAVSIVGAQTRPGYTFLGWARIPEAEGEDGTLRPDYPVTAADLYLKYENGTYYEMDSGIAGEQAVTQVAADEDEPCHAMYAVWEPAPFDVTVSKTFVGLTADQIPAGFQIAYQDQYAQHKTQGTLKLTDEDASVSADGLSYTWTIEAVPYESILTLTESGWQNDYYSVSAKAAVGGGQEQSLTESNGSFSAQLTVDLDSAKNIARFTNTYTRTKADVSVTKTFEGIEAGDIPAAFAIANDYNDTVFTKQNGTAGADGLVYTWTLGKIPLNQTVTFTESGYTLQGYAVYASPAPQAEVTVTADGQNAVAFTNIYAERKDISVTKTFTGLAQADFDALKPGFKITYSVNGSALGELKLTDPDVTVNGTTYTWTVRDAGVGVEYVFTEEGYTHPEYDVSVNTVGSPLTVSRTGSNAVSITNAYQHKTAPLTITKTVAVPEGFALDADKTFAFTVTVTDTPAVSGRFGDVTLTNGQGSFSLKHGESITLAGLPVGAAYSVTEAASQGYTPDAAVKSGAIQEGGNADAFTNSYAADSVQAQIPVTKVLNVQNGTAPDITAKYSFTIAPVDGAPLPDSTTVNNPGPAGGTASYPAVTYTKPGTYEYTVTESGDVPGVVNDGAAASGKTATVTVTDDGQGHLLAQVTGVTFTNVYSETSVSVTKAWADESNKYALRPDSLTLTLKRQNETVDVLPTVTKNGDTWTYIWTGLPEKNSTGAAYEYSVTEDSVPEGYSVSGSPSQNGGTITNTLDTGSLTVTKTVSIEPESAADGKTYAFSVSTVKNGKTLYVQSDASLSETAYSFTGLTPANAVTVEGLPVGSYTVTEQGTEEGSIAQIANYTLSASGGGEVAVEKDQTAASQLVNSYTQNTAALTVSKSVDGNMGNREMLFTFTVSLSSALPADYAAPEGVSLNADRTVLSFSLKHGQNVTLPDLPIGATITIVETNGAGYLTSHSVPGAEDSEAADSEEARTCTFTLPQTGETIRYTNSLNVSIPTGIALGSLPYALLIALAALMLALTAPIKRRKRED